MRTPWMLTAAAVLALAGCGDDSPTTPATTTPAPAATTAAAPASAPASAGTGDAPGVVRFVEVVRDKLPEVAVDRRDEEIEGIATRACVSLTEGTAADSIVAETRALGTLDAEAADDATARELIKLAIDTVCPERAARVDEF